jgi:hypothetical protein
MYNKIHHHHPIGYLGHVTCYEFVLAIWAGYLLHMNHCLHTITEVMSKVATLWIDAGRPSLSVNLCPLSLSRGRFCAPSLRIHAVFPIGFYISLLPTSVCHDLFWFFILSSQGLFPASSPIVPHFMTNYISNSSKMSSCPLSSKYAICSSPYKLFPKPIDFFSSLILYSPKDFTSIYKHRFCLRFVNVRVIWCSKRKVW